MEVWIWDQKLENICSLEPGVCYDQVWLYFLFYILSHQHADVLLHLGRRHAGAVVHDGEGLQDRIDDDQHKRRLTWPMDDLLKIVLN